MHEQTEKDAVSNLTDEATLCSRISGAPMERVRELARFASERGQSLLEVLVEREGVDEEQLLQKLAEQLNLDYFSDTDIQIPTEILQQVPAPVAIEHHIIPIGMSDGVLQAASAEPFDWRRWDELIYIINRPVAKVLCPSKVIDRLLKANYGLGADTVDHLVANRALDEDLTTAARTTDLSDEAAANEPTVVNLVNKVLMDAIRAEATDIHFEPYENRFRARYRVDGMLENVSLPVSVNLLKAAVVSRIKIMANLDITEKRLPQDGRCQVALAGQEFDLRVSVLPGIYGEAVNIRLQRRQMVKLDLESLGFEQIERRAIASLIDRPHGLILVTGPTGSGKTTTLYTCLAQVNKPEVKIITVEDPVEYWMDDVLQMQVHDEIGFSFARALRSILRHDPDMILVGEIRDRETADIAIRSSLTGHMVFATLHTNDSASAATRLLDIGIEPFLAASSLQGIVAQRLVRRFCRHCAEQLDRTKLGDYEIKVLEDGQIPQNLPLWRGRGCERCRFSGFRGRLAIAEVLIINAEMRRLIQERHAADVIKEAAVRNGMRTLRQSALQAVQSEKTTLDEVIRVTQEEVQ